MFDNEALKINIEIIINQKLHEKKIIDEETFIKANDILLKKLNK